MNEAPPRKCPQGDPAPASWRAGDGTGAVFVRGGRWPPRAGAARRDDSRDGRGVQHFERAVQAGSGQAAARSLRKPSIRFVASRIRSSEAA
jgi:hypothetical protein